MMPTGFWKWILRSTYLWVAIAILADSELAFAQKSSLSEANLKLIKEATVFVKVSIADFQSTGSGFLIRKEGKTGYIVTNDHVISVPVIAPGSKPTISVVFGSGTASERIHVCQIVARDPVRDLALLKSNRKLNFQCHSRSSL